MKTIILVVIANVLYDFIKKHSIRYISKCQSFRQYKADERKVQKLREEFMQKFTNDNLVD